MRIADVAGATAGAPAVFCSAVPLRLDAPLAPGARGSVSFDVDIRAPRRPGRFGRRGRMALFSNAIPALAHLEGGAFRLDRYFPFGEAWTYPAADWTVRLDAPARRRRRRARACARPTAAAGSSTAATTRSPPAGCARSRTTSAASP